MSRLHSVCAQKVRAMLLLYQLLDLFAGGQRQDQLVKAPPRRGFKDSILACLPDGMLGCRRGDGDGVEGPLETVRENVMILAALFSNDGLH